MHDISLILPVYNEEKNLPNIQEEISHSLNALNRPYEVIYVNDGSTDDSAKVLDNLSFCNPEVKVIHLSRNYGQTAAIMAGIDHANGKILVLMDADMQNDPNDIHQLIKKLEDGYDVCSGWRHNRKDAKLTKNFPSKIANLLISKVSGVHLHDYGCTLKAYKAEYIKNIKLYGEMHRFIPIYAKMNGASITELPVNHRSRLFGKSNYGLERVFKVVLDLILVKFLEKHYQKPIYVFGMVAFISLILCISSGLYAIYLKFNYSIDFIRTPLPLISIASLLSSLVCLLMGLLAEMISRAWHEPQGKDLYKIRKIVSN